MQCRSVQILKRSCNREGKTDNLLVFFEVSEANKGQLISHKGLRSGECLHIAFVIFNLIKIAGVYVTTELWDHRGNRCQERWREREKERGRAQQISVVIKKKKEVPWKQNDQTNNYFEAAAAGQSDMRGFQFKPLIELTVSNGVKGPLVVFEEGVLLDLLHAVSAQPYLP